MKTRKLKDIELDELSVVESPANDKPFLFFKSGEVNMEELTKLLEQIQKSKDLTDEEIESVEDAIKTLGEVDEEDQPNLVAAITLLSGILAEAEKSDDEEEVKKSGVKWPSVSNLIIVNKARFHKSSEVPTKDNPFPSVTRLFCES